MDTENVSSGIVFKPKEAVVKPDQLFTPMRADSSKL
jgi:hypothetical protein